MLYVFLAVFVFLFIGFFLARKNKKNLQNLTTEGYDTSNIIYTSNYVSGHPDINITNKSFILKKEDVLQLFFGQLDDFKKGLIGKPINQGAIPIKSINNVLVEDKSTIQSRLSYTRIAFNVGLNEKHKNEFAFLTIKWSDGRFDHDTLFEFEDKNAMQYANTARNQILKLIR